jgi:hypothetical protein
MVRRSVTYLDLALVFISSKSSFFPAPARSPKPLGLMRPHSVSGSPVPSFPPRDPLPPASEVSTSDEFCSHAEHPHQSPKP